MVKADDIQSAAAKFLEERGAFLVSAGLTEQNDIEILIDSLGGVSLDLCQDLNSHLRTVFAQVIDDYNLTVGSAGIGCDLVCPMQYQKFKGQQVLVTLPSGERLKATIADADTESFRTTDGDTYRFDEVRRVTHQLNF